jgi:hypothetical protein
MHTILQNKHDFLVKNIGVFVKRVGHELSDVEYVIINEKLDPNEYISLLDLIN